MATRSSKAKSNLSGEDAREVLQYSQTAKPSNAELQTRAKQLEAIKAFGTIDYDPTYNYKNHR